MEQIPNKDWFEVTKGEALLQGDVFFQFPVLVPDPLPWPIPVGLIPQVARRDYNLIVMTQSCDLKNSKVSDVLFAHVAIWANLVKESEKTNPLIKSSKFRKLVVDGNLPSFTLLHKREDIPSLPWAVVDFRQLFVVPKAFVSQFAVTCGDRLRLRSPYREHLAQAFARYFMRVGLPHDAGAFEKEG